MKNYGLNKRILVTGGGGFLGSHLCQKLLGQGHEVICVDNTNPMSVTGQKIAEEFTETTAIVDHQLKQQDQIKAEWNPSKRWNPFNSYKLLAHVETWRHIKRFVSVRLRFLRMHC